jgi:DNA polymerase I-like protein with 3'-5' exonuclease and polymerase domains
MFDVVLPIIQQYRADNAVYAFNNGPLTRVFHAIESNGIKVDKQCFIDCYGKDLNYPQFNLHKGKIYSQYNLYTLTGRPSNTYNSINFAALNKNDGERLCYIPANDKFVEFDMQGYHPRIIGDMISFNFGDRNTYELLGELLGVSTQEAKELTFKQLYGGVWAEYRDQPFFKDIVTLTDGIWDEYQYDGQYSTRNRIFIRDAEMTQSKLLNYIIQSHETSNNVAMLDNILNYLKDKKTKLVLYTYDAFLFDYSKEDGKQLLTDIKEMIHYPINIKQGKSYHGLEKI